MHYCPLPRRLLVMLYDAVILLGLLMLATALLLPFGYTDSVAFRDVWFTLYLLAVCFLYLGSCWHFGGMTVGMRAWQVKLVNRDGGMISWVTCLQRFVVAAVSIALAGLGFLWAIFDKKNSTWHDRIAHTELIVNKK